MTAPTHIVIGMAASIALSRFNALEITPVYLLCILLGSLAPDIDADGSTITRPGKIFKNFLPRGVANFIDQIVTVISKIIFSIFGHRGPMHWPVIGVALYFYGLISDNYYVMWFGWGYLWHIIADAFTVRGVPLLGPFSSRFISLGNIRTGRKSELLVVLPVFFLLILFGWQHLPDNLRYWLIFYKTEILRLFH